jgi:molecular chaperone DnaJ
LVWGRVFEDLYKILGVGPKAPEREIQKAFRRMAKDCHPDVCQGEDAGRFQRARKAYETLSDPQARADYDRKYQNKLPNAAPRPSPKRYYHAAKARRAARSDPARAREAIWEPERLRVDAELSLSPEQAAMGGSLKLEMPWAGHCPACGGSGVSGAGTCAQCRGRGSMTYVHRVELLIKPDTTDGTLLRVRGPGMQHELNILVRVV